MKSGGAGRWIGRGEDAGGDGASGETGESGATGVMRRMVWRE